MFRHGKDPSRGFEGYTIEKRNKNETMPASFDAIASSVKCVVDIDFVELVYND